MSLISVIVPVFKVEPYIHRCIDSILNQTFTDFELILVDDGSPDNSGKICDEYAEKDDRITVIHQKNGGLSAARNAGLDYIFEKSDSEWVTFIDSDDWVNNKYLETMKNIAFENSQKIVCCSYLETDGNNIRHKEDSFSKGTIVSPEKAWVDFFPVQAWCKLFRRDLFSGIRFPVGKIHEDSFIIHTVLFKCRTIAYTEQKLYYYFQNHAGISNSSWNLKRLDEPESFIEQIKYFDENSFTEARNISIIRFFYKSINAINHLQKDFPEKKKTYKKTRKDLRFVIKRYGKYIDFDNYNDKDYLLRVAYPFETKVKRKIKKITSILKSKIKK